MHTYSFHIFYPIHALSSLSLEWNVIILFLMYMWRMCWLYIRGNVVAMHTPHTHTYHETHREILEWIHSYTHVSRYHYRHVSSNGNTTILKMIRAWCSMHTNVCPPSSKFSFSSEKWIFIMPTTKLRYHTHIHTHSVHIHVGEITKLCLEHVSYEDVCMCYVVHPPPCLIVSHVYNLFLLLLPRRKSVRCHSWQIYMWGIHYDILYNASDPRANA